MALNSQRLLAKAKDPTAVAGIAADIHVGEKPLSHLIACQLDVSRPLHGAPDGPVQLKASTTADSLVLQVGTLGPTIAPDSLDRLLPREAAALVAAPWMLSI